MQYVEAGQANRTVLAYSKRLMNVSCSYCFQFCCYYYAPSINLARASSFWFQIPPSPTFLTLVSGRQDGSPLPSFPPRRKPPESLPPSPARV